MRRPTTEILRPTDADGMLGKKAACVVWAVWAGGVAEHLGIQRWGDAGGTKSVVLGLFDLFSNYK